MSLTTNFFPISFPSSEFRISRVPYSTERLHDLRREHNATHSFFRSGDYIYVSPMESADLRLGNAVKLSVSDNGPVVSSLIKHVFFRTFRREYPQIVPLNFYPFQVLSRKHEDDMIAGFLPDDLKGVLSRKKQFEVHFREVVAPH